MMTTKRLRLIRRASSSSVVILIVDIHEGEWSSLFGPIGLRHSGRFDRAFISGSTV